MTEQHSWRGLLKMIINDTHERQRIASELGLNPITLVRWTTQDIDPRPQNLRRLLDVVPHYRDQLLELIRDEEGFEEFSNAGLDDSSKDIPAFFCTSVFAARAATNDSMRYRTTCNMVLQQALGQLDPDRTGMSITVVRCMLPRDGDTKIRSLRESLGQGTPPWQSDLEQQAMFLGAESLAGYVVASCRPFVTQNVDKDQTHVPLAKARHERSSAIYPILYAGRIAGCLIVSSAQYNYFLSQSRLNLIKNYTDLIAVAFEPEEFYNPEQIELWPLPDQEIQKKHFANFRQRVAAVMLEGARNKKSINTINAEKVVWRQLEDELIEVKLNEFSSQL
ncbi:MAG TPA: GAF domain-containing protein [Ktedonobacteraceae bacterium]|nr:GAF domain-containing protein [Ktedonobacteraceae bacterium]